MKLPAMKKFFGILYAFLFYLALVAALTVCSYFFDWQYESIALGSYIITTLCVFCAGVLTARGAERSGWLYGLMGSFAMLLLIILMGRILGGGELDFMRLLIRMPTFVLCGVIGGIIGINLK